MCCHLLFSCREKTQLRKEDEKRKKIRGAGRGCNLASEAKMKKKSFVFTDKQKETFKESLIKL